MSKEISDRLYELLPAIYRIRDYGQGRPLQALLSVMAKQAGLVEDDIANLYDNWFIETCDEWVVPYIGDLLNVRGIHPVSSTNLTMRAYVANTMAYRRRKGAVTVLEQLGHDVTGWKVRAVEFFRLLITNQNVNHVRLDNLATIKVRDDPVVLKKGTLNEDAIGLKDDAGLENLNGPFEQAAHTIEVRKPSTGIGKYNLPNIGLFLWRLQSYPITSGTARRISDGCYTFCPLGNDMSLFNVPVTEGFVDHLIEEIDVPGTMRPRAFQYDLQEHVQKYPDVDEDKLPESTDYYGPGRSFSVCASKNRHVKPKDIVAGSLCHWARPEAGKVAVDVVLGRIAFAQGESPTGEVLVNYAYGFSGDIGGGPYSRQSSAQSALERHVTWHVGLSKDIEKVGDENIFRDLKDAIDEWNKQPEGTTGLIAIMDSMTYEISGKKIKIDIPEGSQLTIIAAGWPIVEDPGRSVPKSRRAGQITADELRPHLITDISVRGTAKADVIDPGSLILNGLLIEGAIVVEAGNLGKLHIVHSTIVPGHGLNGDGKPVNPLSASISVDASKSRLSIDIDHSIVGPLKLPENMTCLKAKDSIIDSPLRNASARQTPVLLSGGLTAPVSLASPSPSLEVIIGDEGPYRIQLTPGQKTLDQIAAELQAAIRGASNSNAFRGTQVRSLGDRLLILPGLKLPVTIKAAGNIKDKTAYVLRLDPKSAVHVIALVSGKLSPFPKLGSASPALGVIMGNSQSTAVLQQAPGTLEDAKKQLQDAIQRAGAGPFKYTTVSIFDDRLIVLPGLLSGQAAPAESLQSVMFTSHPRDQTTLADLALECALPAIFASGDGTGPGPQAVLERTTVFGEVHVKELKMASEVIFNDPAVAVRRQSGCIRFSFVPEGSLTTQRYCCQPDGALEKKAEEDRDAGQKIESSMDLPEAERDSILSRIRPEFTSVHYGMPGYAQLSLNSAIEIRTGAEDGSEMGAFCFLKQSQREANMRSVLDEYLRFGLEAGLFFVT